ncbi:diphosphomevalonate decarboxylase [Enterococcus timonensis]|uniref:diphosphomevalonate decarboxylase n=1 Tax=Enterococcus timonensis TaxID=1852364 RepID=UPI0008D9C020|nr:diphosphomevalonate decarboxylase [Enterococcus timonensis]
MTSYAKAHTNIALIKYWGKKDPQLMLPMNNSISLTLDAFYTETWVSFQKELTSDRFILNETVQDTKQSKKVVKFLNEARAISKTKLFAEVKSINHVPTAAGLASSASGMAALAGATSLALGLPLDDISLSRLARHGSGSATRSIYGGFSEWQKGSDDATSYAVPLKEDLSDWDLAMIFILINDQPKKISSTAGMAHTVETSIFYPGWLKAIDGDLKDVRQAISEKNFTLLGETAERNALRMHATMLGANPPFTYLAPGTLTALDIVQKLREQGILGYCTMDAGPNVKVLVEKANVKTFLDALSVTFPKENLVVAFPGRGIELKEK